MAHIAQVIKYEGDNNTFVWKHPTQDFNTSTQLVVHESQEAIFFNNGQALDLFGPGRHSLETQNIPLIQKQFNLATDGATPFHCEVYFINKTEQMAIKWGTDSKVQYVEPTYGFPIYIGANGEMSLSVNDSRKLLLKLVGTETELSRDVLVRYFRSILQSKIKTYIAREMKSKAINIFEIDEYLEEFSDSLRTKLSSDFLDYGLNLTQFYFVGIAKPDGDPQYEKFKEIHFRQYADVAEANIEQQVGVINEETDAKKTVIKSKAMATKRAQEGYSYQDERGFDVAEKIAENEAVGEFSNVGVGLGMMAGAGAAVGKSVGGVVDNAITGATNPTVNGTPPAVKFCDQCGTQLEPGASFCSECGAPVATMDASTCVKCGYKFTKPGKFCPNCGSKREI